MAGAPFRIHTEREGPLVATAVHNGHELRDEIAVKMVLPESDRLREEDPYTGRWTEIGDTRIVVERSRFEADLNRPRETAIYVHPEDSWGLRVWKSDLTEAEIERSLAEYDAFYEQCGRIFSRLEKKFGFFVVFDLHSYNHLRSGPDSAPADPEQNPEVNVGTGSLNRTLWGPVVDRFIEEMRTFDFLGRSLDVRENVKFKGRQLAKWTHERFPKSGCVLAIEFKKFFMNEWTGEIHRGSYDAILRALRAAAPRVADEAGRVAGGAVKA